LLTAIWAILIFCVLIFVHEFGHFITAKLSGMTVHEFSIGMGPKIFGLSKNNTTYNLRLLPLGGFVKLEGEDGESDDSGAFCNMSAFKRFIVLFAGAFMNVVIGFLIFAIIFSNTSLIASNTVGSVVEDSAFEKAGIKEGDTVVYMKGEKYSSSIHSFRDITLFLSLNGDSSATITFNRDGNEFTKIIKPTSTPDSEKAIFGMTPGRYKKGFLNTIRLAFWECVFVIKSVYLSLWWLITGAIPASSMSGPVAIVGEIGAAAKMGWQSVLNLAGFISVNLGVMNLLPIPALDGGRILFLLIEKIRGKKMNPELEGTINFVFFALLIILMFIVTVSDVNKIL